MTIRQAIERVDRLIRNEYDNEEKVSWLKAVDTLLQRELVERHQGGVKKEINYSTENLDEDLIAHSPYDEMYIHYLMVKIYYFNGEIELYNNAAEEYNNILHEYRKWYIRNHKDLPTPRFTTEKTYAFNADIFNKISETDNGGKKDV